MSRDIRVRLLIALTATGLGAVWPWAALGLPPLLAWIDER